MNVILTSARIVTGDGTDLVVEGEVVTGFSVDVTGVWRGAELWRSPLTSAELAHAEDALLEASGAESDPGETT